MPKLRKNDRFGTLIKQKNKFITVPKWTKIDRFGTVINLIKKYYILIFNYL